MGSIFREKIADTTKTTCIEITAESYKCIDISAFVPQCITITSNVPTSELYQEQYDRDPVEVTEAPDLEIYLINNEAPIASEDGTIYVTDFDVVYVKINNYNPNAEYVNVFSNEDGNDAVIYLDRENERIIWALDDWAWDGVKMWLYAQAKESDKLISPQSSVTVTVGDVSIIDWWDLSGVKHTIEKTGEHQLARVFQGRNDVSKVDIRKIGKNVTQMDRFMENCVNCTEFICSASTKNITNFYSAWYNCSRLTSFPLIDTSSGTSFGYAWYRCSSLTSFPLIDTSSGTSFIYTWYFCTSLTSFPLIDTSSGLYFGYAWRNCTGLTSFPLIDTSSGTNFRYTWYLCSSLTSFPHINTSSGTDFGYAWYGCQLPTLQCVPDGECGNCVMTFDDGVEVPSGDTRYVCF